VLSSQQMWKGIYTNIGLPFNKAYSFFFLWSASTLTKVYLYTMGGKADL
jgi:hypothetical protein